MRRRLRTAWILAALGAGVAGQLAAQQAGPEPDEARGRQAGQAAGSSLSGGWFTRGLVGGLIGGPIGTGIAFSLAGRSSVELPPTRAAELAGHPPLYSSAFREAYEEQRRLKRKESAFVGGMLGTAVWTWMILRAVDLVGGGSVDGGGGGEPDPGA